MALKDNRRAIIVVLDSVGVGELPDAASYGDTGANTLGHIDEGVGGLLLPNLGKLGLGNIIPLLKIKPALSPLASYGKSLEKSQAKDTILGHWEIAGLISPYPLPVYPKGFPPEIIDEFERRTGKKTIGNYAASGTEIIARLGEEHYKTGAVIVYTSADSVFQVAAHTGIVPIEELYGLCATARKILTGKHMVGRVIARPFTGEPGGFKRTHERKDFAVSPPGRTLLDHVSGAGMEVVGVGKIYDIFTGNGLKENIHTESNRDGIEKTVGYIKKDFKGLLFTNLVDFDMLFGHRNDVRGYAGALAEFDAALPEMMGALRDDDMLIITADHGCDPGDVSTDHTREYTPLIVYGRNFKGGVNLGIRQSFSDIASTVSEYLSLEARFPGESFLKNIA